MGVSDYKYLNILVYIFGCQGSLSSRFSTSDIPMLKQLCVLLNVNVYINTKIVNVIVHYSFHNKFTKPYMVQQVIC